MIRDEDRVRANRGEQVTVTAEETADRPRGVVRRERAPEQAEDWQIELPEALNLRRDRVRWGPVWAGLLTAMTSLLLLSLLGIAIGLTTVNAGTAAAQGGPPQGTGLAAAIWGALTAIVSFLLGGYVAGKTAAVFGRGWGAFNGALVFLLGVPITLLLAGLGLGGILGTLGSFASSLNIHPSMLQGAANQAQQATPNVQPTDVVRAAEGLRNGAWGTLIGLLLGLGASALGGALGTRRKLDLDRATGQVTNQ